MERQDFGAWDGMQRQGVGMMNHFTSLAQGLGCILQSHMPPAPTFTTPSLPFSLPSQAPSISLPFPQSAHLSSLANQWPWSSLPDSQTESRSTSSGGGGGGRGVGGDDFKFVQPLDLGASIIDTTLSIHHLGQDVGSHFGQAGAMLGACLGELAGSVMQRFSPPPVRMEARVAQSLGAPSSLPSSVDMGSTTGVFSETRQPDARALIESTGLGLSRAGQERNREPDTLCEEQPSSSQQEYELRGMSDEEVISILSKAPGQHQKQGSAFVSTTFSSRTQEIETNVVARGELWRAEATQCEANPPLFLVQVGPILFVRASTLLIPIHLSKRHCLWYGFDRKEGLHSLCPAIWSEHRRWLAMAMLCLNPITCSFLDLQFPNGQLTYLSGDGVTGSAFMRTCGGLLQAQGRYPGDTKLSYSYKSKLGTRLTPAVQFPEKSVSVELVQPLAWQRSGMMVRPTVELSVTPVIGGRNPGWRMELVHFPLEKLSWGCGCAQSVETRAFASVSLGRSKRNGEHIGSSGLAVQVETPVDNIRRSSFTVQLNSGIEF